MRFSSFITITAAGLAIAAPITPVSPTNTEKQLTVEPAVVYKRQSTLSTVVDATHGDLPAAPIKRGLPDTSALSGVLPVKRGLPDTSALSGLLPTKRGLPDTSALSGLLPTKRGLPDLSAVTSLLGGGLPVKRQLGGLGGGSSDDDDEESDPTELGEPKEPKEPTIVDGTETEEATEDDAAADEPVDDSVLGSLPVRKRQLGGLLGGEDTPAPEPAADAADEAAPAEEEAPTEEDAAEEEPAAPEAESSSPLGGLGLRKRQLGSLLPGSEPADNGVEPELKEPAEPKEPKTVSDGTVEDDTTEDDASAASALPGLPVAKRQLDGITKMLNPDPAPEPAADDAAAPADEEATEEEPAEDETEDDTTEETDDTEAPAEDAAAEPAAESSSPLGSLGLRKRQLGGLTSGLMPSSDKSDAADAPADPSSDDNTTVHEQVHNVNDGTGAAAAAAPKNTTEAATAPAKNATAPAEAKPAKKAGGLGSLLGM